MRTLIGLALTAAFAPAFAGNAGAQWPQSGGAPYPYAGRPSAGYPRGHAFADESLFSVNNSYLGYGNFIDRSPSPSAPGYFTGRAAPRPPGYAAPARHGRRFWRRQGSRY